MEIKLQREHFNDQCTIGTLDVDGGKQHMFTLEDKDRRLTNTDKLADIKAIKVHGRTAIPYGRYQVTITMSNRFKRDLPLLLNVPGFEGIRIHPGNTSADTEGCILVGTQKDVVNDRILNSRAAFNELFALIQQRIKTEQIFITITNTNAR